MAFTYVAANTPGSDAPLDLEFYQNPAVTYQQDTAFCPFCQGHDPSLRIFDLAQALGAAEVMVRPALGMMIPGYFLAVTPEHLTSFSQLEPEQLEEVDESLTQTEAYLGNFDELDEYFRLEHGSDNVAECGSGACIDHAHQHLVPAPDVADVILDALPWGQLASYTDLIAMRGKPYVYFGRQGEHYAIANPALPSQWVRRKIAEVRGMDNWDWGTYHGVRELVATFMILGKFPRGRIIWSPDSDAADYQPSEALA